MPTVIEAAASGDTVADLVFGQSGGFTTATINAGGISASGLNTATSVAADAMGRLWVADTFNNRVLEYDTPLTSQTAIRVFGQGGNFTTNDANHGGISASSLNWPTGVAVDHSGRLYVSDDRNNRVLEYDTPLASQTADRVFGQGGNFTTATANTGGVSRLSLNAPVGLAVDAAGHLYVADASNNRVLEYDAPLTSQAASRVFGQAGSFTTNDQDHGGLSASSLWGPLDLALDIVDHLYVADTANNRVLEYDTPLTSQTAIRVFGQDGNFTTNDANHGGISSGFNSPRAMAADAGGHLYVGDSFNYRVLEYDAPLTSQTANRVFGQGGNFTTNDQNHGGLSASSLSFTGGVTVDALGNLYVGDTGNNRVLEYDGAASPPQAFKLPYAPTAGVVWTGGPHALLAGGQLQATFPPGKGSGMDFSNGNFDVLAIADGTVKAAHCDDTKPLGCIVAVEHAGGRVSVYAHLQKCGSNPCAAPPVAKLVTRGDKIAQAGGTGTGANGLVHLHLELRQGNGTGTICSGKYNENPTSDCFGDPLDWDGIVIDGWTIHEYFKPDQSVAYNYDGSATKGSTRAVPDFPYSDGGRPGTPTILRTVAANVGTTYPTCVSATPCEHNTFSRSCMPGAVATSTPPPAPTPDPCSSLTQFGGSGVLGGGGQGGAEFREFAAPHIELGDDLGELTSTNQPAPSVGGIAEQPDVTTLPAASGHNFTAYILGAVVAVMAAAGAAGWRRRRG